MEYEDNENDRVKVNTKILEFNRDISDLQSKLNAALDKREKIQEKNGNEHERAHTRILLSETVLDNLLQVRTTKIAQYD